ncbi:MAG: hypothetical protein E7290_02080 [Lachnospiraceae bacterium]|nr:hypothetical protein [Lachnospiraceae bacterium]
MKKELSAEAELNEKKKEYLNQYLECIRAVRRIEGQIEELRINAMCPSMHISDMPRANAGQGDLSDYIVKEHALIGEMIRLRYKRIETYTDIFRRIEMIEKEDEREVLTLRYIRGYKWEKIASDINMSWRNMHRIHARALESFQLPEAKEKTA